MRVAVSRVAAMVRGLRVRTAVAGRRGWVVLVAHQGVRALLMGGLSAGCGSVRGGGGLGGLGEVVFEVGVVDGFGAEGGVVVPGLGGAAEGVVG